MSFQDHNNNNNNHNNNIKYMSLRNTSYGYESRRVRQLPEGLISYLTHCAQQRRVASTSDKI